MPDPPAGPVTPAPSRPGHVRRTSSIDIEKSKLERSQKFKSKFRDRGSVFKPVKNDDYLLEALMGTRALSPGVGRFGGGLFQRRAKSRSRSRSASVSPEKRRVERKSVSGRAKPGETPTAQQADPSRSVALIAGSAATKVTDKSRQRKVPAVNKPAMKPAKKVDESPAPSEVEPKAKPAPKKRSTKAKPTAGDEDNGPAVPKKPAPKRRGKLTKAKPVNDVSSESPSKSSNSRPAASSSKTVAKTRVKKTVKKTFAVEEADSDETVVAPSSKAKGKQKAPAIPEVESEEGNEDDLDLLTPTKTKKATGRSKTPKEVTKKATGRGGRGKGGPSIADKKAAVPESEQALDIDEPDDIPPPPPPLRKGKKRALEDEEHATTRKRVKAVKTIVVEETEEPPKPRRQPRKADDEQSKAKPAAKQRSKEDNDLEGEGEEVQKPRRRPRKADDAQSDAKPTPRKRPRKEDTVVEDVEKPKKRPRKAAEDELGTVDDSSRGGAKGKRKAAAKSGSRSKAAPKNSRIKQASKSEAPRTPEKVSATAKGPPQTVLRKMARAGEDEDDGPDEIDFLS